LRASYPAILYQGSHYFGAERDGMVAAGSAAGEIFWTRTDSDHMQFNFSEIVGNSTAVAISNAYYHKSARKNR